MSPPPWKNTTGNPSRKLANASLAGNGREDEESVRGDPFGHVDLRSAGIAAHLEAVTARGCGKASRRSRSVLRGIARPGDRVADAGIAADDKEWRALRRSERAVVAETELRAEMSG